MLSITVQHICKQTQSFLNAVVCHLLMCAIFLSGHLALHLLSKIIAMNQYTGMSEEKT